MAHPRLRGEEASNLVVAHPAGKTAYSVVDNWCKVRRRSQSGLMVISQPLNMDTAAGVIIRISFSRQIPLSL